MPDRKAVGAWNATDSQGKVCDWQVKFYLLLRVTSASSPQVLVLWRPQRMLAKSLLAWRSLSHSESHLKGNKKAFPGLWRLTELTYINLSEQGPAPNMLSLNHFVRNTVWHMRGQRTLNLEKNLKMGFQSPRQGEELFVENSILYVLKIQIFLICLAHWWESYYLSCLVSCFLTKHEEGFPTLVWHVDLLLHVDRPCQELKHMLCLPSPGRPVVLVSQGLNEWPV